MGGEVKGMCMWPPCLYCDLAEYLAETSKRDLQSVCCQTTRKGKPFLTSFRRGWRRCFIIIYHTTLHIVSWRQTAPPPLTSTTIPTKYGWSIWSMVEKQNPMQWISMQKYCLQMVTKMLVSECGLFVHPEHIYMAASPDAVVSCTCCGKGLLEVKCSLTIAHASPQLCPPAYPTVVCWN